MCEGDGNKKYLIPGRVQVSHVSCQPVLVLENAETDLALIFRDKSRCLTRLSCCADHGDTFRGALHTFGESFRGRGGLQHTVDPTFLKAAAA